MFCQSHQDFLGRAAAWRLQIASVAGRPSRQDRSAPLSPPRAAAQAGSSFSLLQTTKPGRLELRKVRTKSWRRTIQVEATPPPALLRATSVGKCLF